MASLRITVETQYSFEHEEKEKKEKRTLQDFALQRSTMQLPGLSYTKIMRKLLKMKEISTRKTGKIKKLNKPTNYRLLIKNVLLVRQLSVDTDLELDFDSLTNVRKISKYGYKVQGTNIVKNISEKAKDVLQPILFQLNPGKCPPVTIEEAQPEADTAAWKRGILCYKLSERAYIEKGWTVLPIEKVVRKKNVYRVLPAHPELDWFKKHKDKEPMTYKTGEKLAIVDTNGRGCWYYKNGALALKYYDSEEANTLQRYLVYSSGEPDENGRSYPVTVLAMFDQLGNGVVFDHTGKIRLKYDQSDGVVLDRALGPPSHWKWHSLNDPPVLQKVMMDTFMAEKDPDIMNLEPEFHRMPREDFPDMLAIEFDNCIKEQTKKLSQKFQPYQIKMKVLKINDQFSLRIIDQANIHLDFRYETSCLKLNLGMKIDNHEIVSTTTEEAGDVSSSLNVMTDQTDSILNLQSHLNKVRQFHQSRINRDLKKRPVLPKASVDNLHAALSRPICTAKGENNNCERICRKKPSLPNLYYDNWLI